MARTISGDTALKLMDTLKEAADRLDGVAALLECAAAKYAELPPSALAAVADAAYYTSTQAAEVYKKAVAEWDATEE